MISAIILAAGLSSRMGRNKLLLPLGKQSIIEHVVEIVSKSRIDEIIVVLGKDAKDIELVLDRFEIKTILNSDYVDGQSTSVKVGIKAINNRSEGALFFMGDQPMIKVEIINNIIDEFLNSDNSIIVPTYNTKRGNPVLFGSRWFSDLNQVQGDKGGRDILKNNLDQVGFIEISDDLFLKDIDDDVVYQEIKSKFVKGNRN